MKWKNLPRQPNKKRNGRRDSRNRTLSTVWSTTMMAQDNKQMMDQLWVVSITTLRHIITSTKRRLVRIRTIFTFQNSIKTMSAMPMFLKTKNIFREFSLSIDTFKSIPLKVFLYQRMTIKMLSNRPPKKKLKRPRMLLKPKSKSLKTKPHGSINLNKRTHSTRNKLMVLITMHRYPRDHLIISWIEFQTAVLRKWISKTNLRWTLAKMIRTRRFQSQLKNSKTLRRCFQSNLVQMRLNLMKTSHLWPCLRNWWALPQPSVKSKRALIVLLIRNQQSKVQSMTPTNLWKTKTLSKKNLKNLLMKFWRRFRKCTRKNYNLSQNLSLQMIAMIRRKLIWLRNSSRQGNPFLKTMSKCCPRGNTNLRETPTRNLIVMI